MRRWTVGGGVAAVLLAACGAERASTEPLPSSPLPPASAAFPESPTPTAVALAWAPSASPPATAFPRERLAAMLDADRQLDAALTATLAEDIVVWLAQQERAWAEARPQLHVYPRLGVVESVRSRYRFVIAGPPAIRRTGDAAQPVRADIPIAWEGESVRGLARFPPGTVSDGAAPATATGPGLLPRMDASSQRLRDAAAGALAEAIAAADAAAQGGQPQPERGAATVTMMLDRAALAWLPSGQEPADVRAGEVPGP